MLCGLGWWRERGTAGVKLAKRTTAPGGKTELSQTRIPLAWSSGSTGQSAQAPIIERDRAEHTKDKPPFIGHIICSGCCAGGSTGLVWLVSARRRGGVARKQDGKEEGMGWSVGRAAKTLSVRSSARAGNRELSRFEDPKGRWLLD